MRLAVVQRILDQRKPGESAADFARRIGVGPQKLGNWKGAGDSWKAKGGIDIETILALHERTGWSLHWLLTGQGTRDMPAPDEDAYRAGLRDGLEELGPHPGAHFKFSHAPDSRKLPERIPPLRRQCQRHMRGAGRPLLAASGGGPGRGRLS